MHHSRPDLLADMVTVGMRRYYNPELHSAAFVLPQFARQALKDSLTFS